MICSQFEFWWHCPCSGRREVHEVGERDKGKKMDAVKSYRGSERAASDFHKVALQ
jgi:hypothetical protein